MDDNMLQDKRKYRSLPFSLGRAGLDSDGLITICTDR